MASRVEAANKDAGTRLLISEALHDEIGDKLEIVDFIRIRLPGTSDRITLHEVDRLKPETEAELNAKEHRESMLFAGKKWVRVFAEDELAINEHRILNFEDYDVVVIRGADDYFAFNNACPHLHLPLFERRAMAEGDLGYFPGTDTPRPLNSMVVDDRGLVCRWHHSCFDLQTGDVRDGATRLAEDGTSPGWEFLGDISKNQNKLTVYACRIHDGYLWIALE